MRSTVTAAPALYWHRWKYQGTVWPSTTARVPSDALHFSNWRLAFWAVAPPAPAVQTDDLAFMVISLSSGVFGSGDPDLDPINCPPQAIVKFRDWRSAIEKTQRQASPEQINLAM